MSKTGFKRAWQQAPRAVPGVPVAANDCLCAPGLGVGTGAGKPHAIVEAFYPSTRGAEALWMLLTGQANSWGRMPVTLYAENFVEQVDMYNFNMSKAPGRTHRYFTGEPLFKFGAGE